MNDRTRVCRICGVEKDADAFRPKHARCRDCFNAMRRQTNGASVYRNCSECGAHFHAWPAVRLTCSTECSLRRTRRERGTRDTPPADCAQCGTRFQPQQIENIFCSMKCKDGARYSRRRLDPKYLEGRAKYHARYYLENRASVLANGANWREKNADRHQAAREAWAKSRPETYFQEIHRAWRLANPERVRESVRAYRARKAAALRVNFSIQELADKFDYWGNSCWMCGGDANSLDHVKPLVAGGPHMLANFRPACGSCNSAKGGRWYGPQNLSLFLRE